jgi:hypothetical protein
MPRKVVEVTRTVSRWFGGLLGQEADRPSGVDESNGTVSTVGFSVTLSFQKIR